MAGLELLSLPEWLLVRVVQHLPVSLFLRSLHRVCRSLHSLLTSPTGTGPSCHRFLPFLLVEVDGGILRYSMQPAIGKVEDWPLEAFAADLSSVTASASPSCRLALSRFSHFSPTSSFAFLPSLFLSLALDRFHEPPHATLRPLFQAFTSIHHLSQLRITIHLLSAEVVYSPLCAHLFSCLTSLLVANSTSMRQLHVALFVPQLTLYLPSFFSTILATPALRHLTLSSRDKQGANSCIDALRVLSTPATLHTNEESAAASAVSPLLFTPSARSLAPAPCHLIDLSVFSITPSLISLTLRSTHSNPLPSLLSAFSLLLHPTLSLQLQFLDIDFPLSLSSLSLSSYSAPSPPSPSTSHPHSHTPSPSSLLSLPPLPCLRSLRMKGIHQTVCLNKWLVPTALPALRSLDLEYPSSPKVSFPTSHVHTQISHSLQLGATARPRLCSIVELSFSLSFLTFIQHLYTVATSTPSPTDPAAPDSRTVMSSSLFTAATPAELLPFLLSFPELIRLSIDLCQVNSQKGAAIDSALTYLIAPSLTPPNTSASTLASPSPYSSAVPLPSLLLPHLRHLMITSVSVEWLLSSTTLASMAAARGGEAVTNQPLPLPVPSLSSCTSSWMRRVWISRLDVVLCAPPRPACSDAVSALWNGLRACIGSSNVSICRPRKGGGNHEWDGDGSGTLSVTEERKKLAGWERWKE